MSGPMHRRERGYVLIEALLGGVVLMLALAGVFGALAQAHQHVGKALADQTASQMAVEQLEWLRAQPATSNAWKAGNTSPCQALPVKLPTGWTCTLAVTQVEDKAVGGPVSGSLFYKRAVVTVGYRETSVSLETVRW